MARQSLQARSSDAHLAAQVFHWSFLGPRYWPLWLWFLLLWLVTRLPQGAVRALGHGFGRLLYYLVPSRRRVVLQNLALCFPDWDARRRETVAKAHFASAGLTLFESGWVWWSNPQRFAQNFIFEGAELLERLAGKPVLFFGMHSTSVEMVYAFLSLQRPVNILFRVNNNPLWEYMATRSRARYQVRLIPRKQVPEFLSRLRAGQAGLLAADQDLGAKRSLFVPFFGVPTATVTSVHDFARQAGAAVVFAEAFRTPKGYGLRLHALDNYPTDDVAADTQRMNAMIESAVCAHPEQYLWLHKRFKTRPPGEPSLYKKSAQKK